MANKNLVIPKDSLAQLLGVSVEEAKQIIQTVKYCNMITMSDGENLVVFLPDEDSQAVQESQKMWKDLEKNAPSLEKLRSMGLVPEQS